MDDWYRPNYEPKRMESIRKRPIYCLELDKTFESVRDAARFFNTDPSNITHTCRGKNDGLKKQYHMLYVDEIDDKTIKWLKDVRFLNRNAKERDTLFKAARIIFK